MSLINYIVHLEAGKVTLKQVQMPPRKAGFALLRMLTAGICNTDLELQRGYYGFVGTPGHEFVAEVVEADTKELIGKRVGGEINLTCAHCEWCKKHLGRHCPNRTVLGIVGHQGAFAAYLTLPEENLHVIPDSIPTDHAVFLEPVAAACEILDQVAIPGDSQVAVLGDGKLGLLISQVLQARGLKVHQFGRHKEKLAIAEKMGVVTEIVTGEYPKAAYQWVVDATGSADGLKIAIEMAVPRGVVIMKSTVYGDCAIDTASIIVNELTLVGSRCGRFEAAMEILKLNAIDVESMISDRMPLSRAPEAFERAAQKGVLKVLLYPGN